MVAMDTHDNVLISETLTGDSTAYCELVRRHQDRLLRAMTSVTGNRTAAEDIVQEAFVAAYLRLDTFRGDSQFYTWLYRIAFRLALQANRSRKPEVSLEQAGGRSEFQDWAIDFAEPDQSMLQDEAVRQVWCALRCVGQELRAVLVLREIEDLSYQEISEVLEIPLNTVRSRLHRARTELRECLQRMKM